MKYKNPNPQIAGAIPLMIILALGLMLAGGAGGWWLAGGASKLKWLIAGAGLGLVAGLLILPNLRFVVAWWKGIRHELDKK